MWVRLQLDFGWRDFFFGLSRLGSCPNRVGLAHAIAANWSEASSAMPVLSVRSGFDLFLTATGWPAGSEIVCSALNIPDMSLVIREHGLVPVPADLDLETLAPDLRLLEQAITPRTKAILTAHLYGNLVPLGPIIDLARRHGLMVIEDAAEAFDGTYRGHPDVDVTLFSFGPLKTATALAGGMVRTRDPDLMSRMQTIHDTWPVQSRYNQFCRLTKYGTLRFFGAPWILGPARWCIKKFVGDLDQFIHHSAKSFAGAHLMATLRQQPSTPLLAWMMHRLGNFDHARLTRRAANGKLLAHLLRGKVICPGADVEPHSYWLFPVLMTDPAKAIAALADAGFDATQVQTMRPVEAPVGRPELHPARVADALAHMVLVPCWPGIPEAELRRMAEVLVRVEEETSNVQALKAPATPTDTVGYSTAEPNSLRAFSQ